MINLVVECSKLFIVNYKYMYICMIYLCGVDKMEQFNVLSCV